MSTIIAIEDLHEVLFAEALPLYQSCWRECTVEKGASCAGYGERNFAIEPDRDTYLALARNGQLLALTLRDRGKLVGYALGVIYFSRHHKSILCANGDSIYTRPRYREFLPAMLDAFANELEKRGVKMLGWPVHTSGAVHAILVSKGYVADDVVMEKRLCVQ